MGIFNFGFKTSSVSSSDSEIQEIFPLELDKNVFIESDLLNIYAKILTDTFERTHGVPKEKQSLMFDNCVQNESSEGLITLLATAMLKKTELFLVYIPSLNILRRADHAEQQLIRADYQKNGDSPKGVFISFRNYKRTDMLKIYSSFEYCVLGSLNKTLNISKAVQIKMNDLRASVSLNDSEIAKAQARSIATALGHGNDVLLDAKDVVETATVDTSSTEKAIAFLDAKKAFILGLPLAYINGEQSTGLTTTGEADTLAVERGLKQYFVSIMKPVLKAIFKIDVEFKSEDFRQMTTALETVKTFDLVDDEILSRTTKQEIIARVLNIDLDEELKNLEDEAKARAKEAANNPQPRQVVNQPGQNQPQAN